MNLLEKIRGRNKKREGGGRGERDEIRETLELTRIERELATVKLL